MKVLIGAGYLLLVLVGISWLVHRGDPPPTPGLRAVTALPAGRLLMTGDVALRGGPHYLRRAVPAGGAVTSADLVSIPAVSSTPGTLSLAVDIAPGEAPLNAGDAAWLCPAKKPVPPVASRTPSVAVDKGIGVPVRIVSRLCGGDACIAVAAVPADKAASLATARHLVHSQPCR